MNRATVSAFADFPCLLMVSDMHSHKIKHVNEYVVPFLNYQPAELHEQNMQLVLSKSSHIFCETYVYPLLAKNQKCDEVQLFFLMQGGKRIPTIANVCVKDNEAFWVVLPAINRDKMYQELIDTRDHLETKTEALRHLSRIDPLSNLLNRRALMHDLKHMFENNKRLHEREASLSFLLIDIDYFKCINDQYGHQLGDQVIKDLAALLQQQTRNVDLVSRWGGEEFLIVLFDSNPTETEIYANRLHQQINGLVYFNNPLHVSIGVAFASQNNVTFKQAMKKAMKEADESLYRAKHQGRNQTIIHSADN